MKAPDFAYVRPTSLDDAIAALRSGEDVKLLAGGQSLVPLLNMRLVRPRVLVDLARVEELSAIARRNGALRIGAMVTQREAETSPAVRDGCPLLVRALELVAHPPIRNRGTVGGSLAHADPAAELPAAVLLLGGSIHVRGAAGERTIAAEEFFKGYLTTALEPDEVLIAVELPVVNAAGWDFRELTRRPGDFPLAGAASLVEPGGGVRLVLYGVADRPVRAHAAEALLAGGASVAQAAAAAARDLDPPGNLHATPDYRRHLAEVLARRSLEAAIEMGGARA
jgi:CO/xanthine dehydrogenase FAD-binding subunit